MKKLLSLLLFCCFSIIAFSQSSISGQVLEKSSNEPLVGATVFVLGTNKASITDFDGNYIIQDVPPGNYSLEISYLGYGTEVTSVTVTEGSNAIAGLMLEESGVGLESVVITGVMDIVKDRRTPVAVSTIGLREIQAKGGNVEFPELMKATPSIYVAGQAGGYGDSEVFTRGFDQTNTAFLLNGQPINGMEDGKMYWSNWSGMTDVASAVQIQRGLGSSKLAISSVGGTTNIIMKSTEEESGGSVGVTYGNDNYMKATLAYNTGLINNKFGVSMLLSHWQGDGWAEGTEGAGQSYFISAGYKASDRSNFNFLITGAPQWHHQNFGGSISNHYEEDGTLNVKHNGNWGMLNGEVFSSRRNYYHKPVANLNWDFAINDNSKLSTVLYGSWGRGGGSGGIGNSSNRKFTDDGQWDFDAIVAANQASAATGGDGQEYVLRNSVNNHAWYGVVTNYETTLSDAVTLSFGADLRSYNGDHFREVRDLLGASAFTTREHARYGVREITTEFEANPWPALTNFAAPEERIGYNNSETINYGGVFGQVEYTKNALTTYVQGAISNQSHVRYEIFNEVEANEASEKITNLGYNAKVGASYALNDNNTFFVNTGYYSRQPYHDNVFLNFSNTVNPVTENENVIGLELGYKFANEDFVANINAYRTSWKNRTTTVTINPNDTINGIAFPEGGFSNASNLNQLHTGVEIDFGYNITDDITLTGFGSIGSWVYDGTTSIDLYQDDVERTLSSSVAGIDVDGVHVGGSAQTSFGLGLDYEIVDGLNFDADWLFYDNLYSRINASAEDLKLPGFNLLDLGLSYYFSLNGGQGLRIRANVFNALGTEYISRATSSNAADTDDANNWNGVNKSNRVVFGKTRTWNVSAKYSF